jgi:hypothetical protein
MEIECAVKKSVQGLNDQFTTPRDTFTVTMELPMRKIEIIDDVRLRFPDRDAEFDLGLEVGAISVLIAQGLPVIERTVSEAAVEQLRPIAMRFRYILSLTDAGEGMISLNLARIHRRPALRVVR